MDKIDLSITSTIGKLPWYDNFVRRDFLKSKPRGLTIIMLTFMRTTFHSTFQNISLQPLLKFKTKVTWKTRPATKCLQGTVANCYQGTCLKIHCSSCFCLSQSSLVSTFVSHCFRQKLQIKTMASWLNH